MGGLGNYLFQIGAGLTLATKIGTEFNVYERDIMTVHNHVDTYRKNILRNIQFGMSPAEFVYNEGNDFTYRPIPERDNIRLYGYFQSEKYLDRELLLKTFDMKSIAPNSSYLNHILSNNSVSIHVRRGNYLTLPNHHPVCSMDYYRKAMDVLGKDKNYFVFSDDLQWCKENFRGDNFTFVEGLVDWYEMYLMSQCQHNIIANSTFSWWGAWLNQNENVVVSPSRWFGVDKKLDTRDLLPENWIKI